MIAVDHSAGHAKYREDGLHVGNMNVRFGGKQRALRDTNMVEGCLGPGEAKMYLNRGAWGTQFIEGVTTRTVDLNPKPGETQTMSFPPNAPPPFYACDAPRSDVMGRKVRDKQTKRPPQETGGGGSVGTRLEMGQGEKAGAMGARVVSRGDVDDGDRCARDEHRHGSRQPARLQERKPSAAAFGGEPWAHPAALAEVPPGAGRGGDLVLLGDVQAEISAGDQRSPEAPYNRNMVASMCTDTILTVQRVRRFARRTRDYCRAYLALEKGGDIESKDMIEKIRINAKRTATSLTWNLASSTSSSALGPPAGHS